MSRSFTASAGNVQRSARRKASRVKPTYGSRGFQTVQSIFVGRSFIASALQLVGRDDERRVDEQGIVRARHDADPADYDDAAAASERLNENRAALQLFPRVVHIDRPLAAPLALRGGGRRA